MLNGSTIFVTMIFVTVALLFAGMTVPVFGESAQTRKRLKKRLSQLDFNDSEDSYQSLLRKKYLKKLSPPERFLESLPPMPALAKFIEQAGLSMLAYRVVALSLLLGVIAAYVSWMVWRMPAASVVLAVIATAVPYLKIRHARNARMARFEEQLPDAIDTIAEEFEMTFNDISYGSDVRRAMLGLLARIPSVTVMALVTSILVQKETGGNLAEVLEQIAKVIRGRFRLHRKIRTLTAEGRMSAWVHPTICRSCSKIREAIR
jgi:tight adherence protein B